MSNAKSINKRHTFTLTCKYCSGTFDVRCHADELPDYLRCCNTCWENDEPDMARFDRMASQMGATWALEHYGPV